MAEDTELNLALLCFIAYRAMENRVLTDLAAAGFGDITAAQGRVFARIDPDGTRVTDLRDARARLVQIAERGQAAVTVARRTEAEVEAEWTRHLGRVGATQLRRALTRLREITDS
jgi:hypothetical protein